MSDLLRTKLAAVRRRSVLTSAGAGVCLAIGAFIAAIGLGMCADWLWELPFTLRAALLALDLSMLVVLAVRQIILPVLHIPDDDEVALWVERDSPGLRSRLISTIQLTRAGALSSGDSVSLVRALVRQTEELAGPMDFMGVVKTDRLARMGSLAALVVVLGIVGMAFGGTDSTDLLKRAFLVPGISVPRKTRVQNLTPNPLVVALGDDVELRAQAGGIIPTSGSVIVRYDGQSEPSTIPIAADPDHPKQFAAKLSAISRSFSYRIVLNDGHGTDARVEARTRPSVVSMDITVDYPPYTHLPPEKQSPGDLRILAGSRLRVHVKTNKPVKNTTSADKSFNRITLLENNGTKDIPLTCQSADRQSLAAADSATNDVAIPLDAQGLSVHLVDDDGLQTRDPAVYQIQMIPDQPPTVRITYPDRKEQLSTTRAQLMIGVEASDDFALGELILHYRVLPPDLAEAVAADNGSPAVGAPPADLKQPESQAVSDAIPLDLKGTPKEFRGRFQFDLSKLKAPALEHGAVEWWLEADDTNDVTGPGKTLSDHYLTRVGTEAEVRSDLFARLGNEMGEMKEAAETQKQDNADLGEMIQEKVQTPPP